MNILVRSLIFAFAISGTAFAQQPSTSIEIQGQAEKAIKVLRENGLKVLHVNGQQYILPETDISVTQHDGLIVITPKIDTSQSAGLLKTVNRLQITRNGVILSPEAVEKLADNSKVIIAAGPNGTSYQISLTSIFLFGAAQSVTVSGKQEELFSQINVQSPDPVTKKFVANSPPSPTPTPEPPAPSPIPEQLFSVGKYGLAQFSFDSLRAQSSLETVEKKKVAVSLASAYSSLAGQIDSGQLTVFDQVLNSLTTTGRIAMESTGIDSNKLSGFKADIGGKLIDLINKKQILSSTDLSTALKEIVVGMKGLSN